MSSWENCWETDVSILHLAVALHAGTTSAPHSPRPQRLRAVLSSHKWGRKGLTKRNSLAPGQKSSREAWRIRTMNHPEDRSKVRLHQALRLEALKHCFEAEAANPQGQTGQRMGARWLCCQAGRDAQHGSAHCELQEAVLGGFRVSYAEVMSSQEGGLAL